MNSYRNVMIRPKWRVVLVALALVLGVSAEPSAAQRVRTLSIRAGAVYIDGSRVPQEQLPASFKPGPAEMQFRFTEDQDPILKVGGHLYRLDGDRLVEVEGTTEAPVQVFYHEMVRPPATVSSSAIQAVPRDRMLAPPPRIPVNTYVLSGQELLEQQALELEQLSHEIRASRLLDATASDYESYVPRPEQDDVFRQRSASLRQRGAAGFVFQAEPLADRLMLQAERVLRAAQQLPQIEINSYLNSVEQQNRELYQRLVREQQLEQESLTLAGQIRNMPVGPARRERESILRDRLEQIFALKQENRRREVEQMRQQLGELQRRLDERERLHEQIIDARMKALIGDEPQENR